MFDAPLPSRRQRNSNDMSWRARTKCLRRRADTPCLNGCSVIRFTRGDYVMIDISVLTSVNLVGMSSFMYQ